MEEEFKLYERLSIQLTQKEAELKKLRSQMASMKVLGLIPDGHDKLPDMPKSKIPSLKESYVTASVRDGVLKISAPLLLLRYAEESQFLADMAAEQIRKYETACNMDIGSVIKPPVFIVVKRKSEKTGSGYRDNENLETKKIIDSVFKELGYPDSPENAGYISVFSLVNDKEESGTDIFIFNKDSVSKNWKYFNF